MIELIVVDRDEWVSAATAELTDAVTTALRSRSGPVWVALSGGATPKPVFAELAAAPLDWSRVHITQVDERIAPDGDPARNLTMLHDTLGATAASWHPMPATDDPKALARFTASLPEVIDVIHLGLGSDGHTASLVPGDPVLGVTDRRVAVTGPYHGHRRVTLTPGELIGASERGSAVRWLVRGGDKAHAVGGVLAGFASLPATAVVGSSDRMILDSAAAGALGP